MLQSQHLTLQCLPDLFRGGQHPGKGACLGVKSLALRWTGVRLGALVVVLRSLMLLGAVIRIHGLGDRKVFGRVYRGCLQIVINFAHPRHSQEGVGNNSDKSVSPV